MGRSSVCPGPGLGPCSTALGREPATQVMPGMREAEEKALTCHKYFIPPSTAPWQRGPGISVLHSAHIQIRLNEADPALMQAQK